MENEKKKTKKIDIEKELTGIEGFDEISHGGIPKGRSTLVSGTSGAGKTVFAMQFIVNGCVKYDEPGVFVTFEESPQDIVKNMKSFGWDIQKLIDDEKFMFVDGSPSNQETVEMGEFDLGGFLARILNASKKIGAKRLTIDSISALFPRYSDQGIIRKELFRLASELKKLGITTILTAERVSEQSDQIGRFGIEEFVSDNVILLHNYLDIVRGDRMRSVEILKFRGTGHESQDTPLLVTEEGVKVFPRPRASYEGQSSSQDKISTGITGLDKKLFGGLYKNSTTLVTGASGAGKTVTGMSFIMEGARNGEKGLLIAFEESDEQLFRNAESFGWDLRGAVEKGLVTIIATVPEQLKPEEHFKFIKDLVKEKKVTRVVIDSLSALERIYAPDRFREFTVGLNVFLKGENVSTYLTNTTASLLDVSQITESHLSTATDNIILLKYVELDGGMKRAVAIIKARGSDHDKALGEIVIDGSGMHVIGQFYGVENLMGGSARRVIMPPADITEQQKKIEVLRAEYVEGKVEKADYEKQVNEMREALEIMQLKNAA